jgi:hypothetical protein
MRQELPFLKGIFSFEPNLTKLMVNTTGNIDNYEFISPFNLISRLRLR